MSFGPREYLSHILTETAYLLKQSRELSAERFYAVDHELVWDVVKTKIPRYTRKYPKSCPPTLDMKVKSYRE